MRKVILSMMVSLDGYIEGSNRNIDWHVWSEEMDRFMGRFFDRIDTILLGRKTYELLVGYWPSASEPTDDPVITDRMNKLPKIVFSKTLESVAWNARLVKENIAEEVTRLKQQPGKDIVIFGGADIASTFMQHDLIDEYQLIVNPVVLGSGKPLFNPDSFRSEGKCNFKLLKTTTFHCGNVVLYYQPERKEQK